MSEVQIYDTGEVELEVRCQSETLWLTLGRIADLFGVQKPGISKHLGNIFSSGELRPGATVSKMEAVQTEGGRSTNAQEISGSFLSRSASGIQQLLRPENRSMKSTPNFLVNFRQKIIDLKEIRLSVLGIDGFVNRIARNNTRHASPRKRTRAGFLLRGAIA